MACSRLGRLPLIVPLVAGLLLSLNASPPVPAQEYVIGARDVLRITVWGQDDLTRDYQVDADGFVPFPLVGRVKAAGLNDKQFATRLADLLEKDYLENPQVMVTVKEFLSKKVHVLGEAEKPGLFYLAGPTTILEIISKAGGLSRAAGRQLVLIRSGGSAPDSGAKGNAILRINFERIQGGDTAENILLEDQDMVFVPKANGFFVLGEVKVAGAFPLEKASTVLDAITLAGGFSDKAAPSGVKLIRRLASGEQETISLDLSGGSPRDQIIKIQEGDTLLVPKGNTFFVFGEVKRPGAYQLDKETNILEGITIAGGFTDKAAPGRARLIRSTPTGPQVLNIDMNDIIRRGQRDKALRLQENDVVVVPESFF